MYRPAKFLNGGSNRREIFSRRNHTHDFKAIPPRPIEATLDEAIVAGSAQEENAKKPAGCTTSSSASSRSRAMMTRKSGVAELGSPKRPRRGEGRADALHEHRPLAFCDAHQALQAQQPLAQRAGEIVEPGREIVVGQDAGRPRETHGDARMSGRRGDPRRAGIGAHPASGAKAAATAATRSASRRSPPGD